jgi:DNA-binding IclR family transcriptional regulator
LPLRGNFDVRAVALSIMETLRDRLVAQCTDALDDEKAEIDVGCIGVQLHDATGNVIGGLSVSAPIERRRLAWVPEVLAAGAEISAKLGYCPPGA